LPGLPVGVELRSFAIEELHLGAALAGADSDWKVSGHALLPADLAEGKLVLRAERTDASGQLAADIGFHPHLAIGLLDQARQQLAALCERCEVPAASGDVQQGSPSHEIQRIAREQQMDLIVIGHHPRRGLAALFSHTDGHVVQRAPCDVLAIRLPD